MSDKASRKDTYSLHYGYGTFFSAFFITLAILIFVIGIIVVDCRGRSMSFGDNTPPFQIIPQGTASYLRIKVLGIDKYVNFTLVKNFLDGIMEFICL